MRAANITNNSKKSYSSTKKKTPHVKQTKITLTGNIKVKIKFKHMFDKLHDLLLSKLKKHYTIKGGQLQLVSLFIMGI